MISLIRTNAENLHFQHLVRALDAELAILDGKDHSFYNQFNKIDKIRFAVVAIEDEKPVGCGAIKEYAEDAMEVKRMYVPVKSRGRGIATLVLAELEKWAREMNINKCILETGKRQPDAIALYKKCGYQTIPNFGQYAKMENSVCFEKSLRPE
jgi:GNAT superfamily N-acetyltransferase